ncbi:MAG: hypothetical protein ACM3MG_11775 [Bacillota bacterium]
MKIDLLSVMSILTTLAVSTPSFAASKVSKAASNQTASSTVAVNQNAAFNSSTMRAEQASEFPMVSGFIQASRSTNLYDFQDGTRQDGMDYIARVNINLTKIHLIRIDGGYTQSMTNPEMSDWNDTSISFRKNPTLISWPVLLGYSVGGVIPTSKDSYKRQNSIASATTSLTAAINPSVLKPGVSVTGILSFAKNFHEYETDINGKVLNQYTSSQILSLSYEWPARISISANLVHRNALTYQNNIRESFEISEELGYDINKRFSVALGHSNSGNALKPNGVDSNIQVMDENSSVIYASGTMTF